MTYYEILQVSENASQEVIHMAYKALLKKYHPDLNRDNIDFANYMTAQINEAYAMLSEPSKKESYDEYLTRYLVEPEFKSMKEIIADWKGSDRSEGPYEIATNAVIDTTVDNLIASMKKANEKLMAKKTPKDLIEKIRIEVCAIARGAALYVHNERNFTKFALQISMAMRDEFNDIPFIADRLAGDIQNLERQLTKVEAQYKTPAPIQHQAKSKASRWQDRVPPLVKFFSAVLIVCAVYWITPNFFEVVSSEPPSTTESTKSSKPLIPVSEPKSGDILQGYEDPYGSEITIKASEDASCLVKLKNRYDQTVTCFYVRAGDTVTVGIPKENLYVYFATGKTWYGLQNLFGNNTSYSMDEEIQDFSNYTITYTLYSVSNGNFSETPISEDQFKY